MGNAYLRACLAAVVSISAALPAFAVDDATVKTQTKTRKLRDGKFGTETTTRTEVYRWVPETRNVVALWRQSYSGFLDDLANKHTLTWRDGRGGFTSETVMAAVNAVGWDKLFTYAWQNTTGAAGDPAGFWAASGGVNKASYGTTDQVAAAVQGKSDAWDQSWGSMQELILIDVDQKSIVGSVKGSDDLFKQINAKSMAVSGSGRGHEAAHEINDVTANLTSGESLKVNVKGAIWYWSPIVLDLAGRGKPDLLARNDWRYVPGRQLADGALRSFDIDGSGKGLWEWVGPQSGLLVWDPEHKGQITSGRQLFGNATWGKRWVNGYQPLATLDKNRDGRLTGAELSDLAVWQDADSDGISDAGEVKPLADRGITAIGVRPQRDNRGNTWTPGGFEATDEATGKTRWAASWDWISYGLPKVAGGTYVWMAKVNGEDIGGIIKLRSDGGKVRGLGVRTIGAVPVEGKWLVGVPFRGQSKGNRLAWHGPDFDGTREFSDVIVSNGGNRLSGKSKLVTPTSTVAYDWQAQLVAGQPLGKL
jgi:hypothetical protein